MEGWWTVEAQELAFLEMLKGYIAPLFQRLEDKISDLSQKIDSENVRNSKQHEEFYAELKVHRDRIMALENCTEDLKGIDAAVSAHEKTFAELAQNRKVWRSIGIGAWTILSAVTVALLVFLLTGSQP